MRTHMFIWDPACYIYTHGDQAPCLCAQLQAWLHKSSALWTLAVGDKAVEAARVRDEQSQCLHHDSGTPPDPTPHTGCVWMCVYISVLMQL